MMEKGPDNIDSRRLRPLSSSKSSKSYKTLVLCIIKNSTPSKIHTLFTVSLLFYIFIITKDNFDTTNHTAVITSRNKAATGVSSSSNSNSKNNNPNEPRLGDGCYNILIDVGGNVGVHGRFLFEPEKYPDSFSSVQLFRDEYGVERNNLDYCVFVIEANPQHWKRLDIISDAYSKLGWNYHVIKAAASDKNGNMTFYHQGYDDNQNNEWGFSNVHDYQKRNESELFVRDNTTINTKYHSKEIVPAIRLSEWIQYHILERTVPKVPPSLISMQETTMNNTTGTNNTIQVKPPILGMKMDIEGSEYIVLPDLIHSNTVCQFQFIFGEFHLWFAPIQHSVGHRVSLKTVKELMEYEWAIIKIIESSRNCLIRWITSDDESYLHDGIPLPTLP
jgi:hypothetical protein